MSVEVGVGYEPPLRHHLRARPRSAPQPAPGALQVRCWGRVAMRGVNGSERMRRVRSLERMRAGADQAAGLCDLHARWRLHSTPNVRQGAEQPLAAPSPRPRLVAERSRAARLRLNPAAP